MFNSSIYLSTTTLEHTIFNIDHTDGLEVLAQTAGKLVVNRVLVDVVVTVLLVLELEHEAVCSTVLRSMVSRDCETWVV